MITKYQRTAITGRQPQQFPFRLSLTELLGSLTQSLFIVSTARFAR